MVARARIAANDHTAEQLLIATIAQCEKRPAQLSRENLVARGELLKLYQKLGTATAHRGAFMEAMDSLKFAWDSYEWDEEAFATFEFVEAALQFIANILKSGYNMQARRMFLVAGEKAALVFGSDDERTVWVLITIGLVYQTYMTWNEAEEWFDQAFAAALANRDWGPKDGIVKSLQAARDQRHFSYVSSEGRPYKTVFGVSGIKIMPGRLHLE